MSDDGDELPPCGLYRTTARLGDVPAGSLVFFHNHGDPDPGVFLPAGSTARLTTFRAEGIPLPGPRWARTLDPLLPEGYYRAREAFVCCERGCRTFAAEQLIVLAYTVDARPVLYSPEIVDNALVLPEQGNVVDRAKLSKLARLEVPSRYSR